MAEAQYAHNHVINPQTGFLENPAYAHDFDSEKKQLFLRTYLDAGMGLYRTCRKLGMSCSTVHKHYQIDPVFKEQFDEIKREYGDELEATSRQNALNPKSVIERIFQLKALFPEKYGDRRESSAQTINITIDSELLKQVYNRSNTIEAEIISTQQAEMKTLEDQQVRLPVNQDISSGNPPSHNA